MRKLVILLTAILGLASVASAQDIIIESKPQGKNYEWYSEVSGNWLDSEAKSSAEGCSPASIGSRFVTITGSSKVTAEARFSPDIPEPGEYEILVTWGRSGNAFNTKYVINTGDKKVVKHLDQAGWGGQLPPNANQWRSLGTYKLPQGKKAYVAVLSEDVKGIPSPENSGRIYADAARFVKGGLEKGAKAEPTATPSTTASGTPGDTPSMPFVPLSTPPPYSSSQPSPTPTQSSNIYWYMNYSDAIKAGQAAGKSILLFFCSEMGRASNKMEDEVLAHPEVTRRLSDSYISCKLDISSNRRICDYYGVFKAPVLIFLDNRGYSQARVDQVISPQELARELDKYKSSP